MIHRHGQLSSNFFYEAGELLLGRKHKSIAIAIKKFANESNNDYGGRFLTKPDWQRWTENANHIYRTYDLSVYGESLLKDRGKWTNYAIPPLVRSTSEEHDYMGSTAMASLWLATLKTPNIRYIHGDEILERAGVDSMRFNVTVDGKESELRPDALGGFEYQTRDGPRYRFFLGEWDRSTERVNSKSAYFKSIAHKLEQYRDFIVKGKYKDILGLTAPMVVLFLTNSTARKDNLLQLQPNEYTLLRAAPHFPRGHKPSHVMYELLNEPWERAGHPPVLLTDPKRQ
jgi:hypothetical protein